LDEGLKAMRDAVGSIPFMGAADAPKSSMGFTLPSLSFGSESSSKTANTVHAQSFPRFRSFLNLEAFIISQNFLFLLLRSHGFASFLFALRALIGAMITPVIVPIATPMA
jgi:hypothetical protein